MKTKQKTLVLLSGLLFLIIASPGYSTVYMEYTGKVVYLDNHGGGHITLGLDGGGDGESDLTNDYYGVDEQELQDLLCAGREGKSVKIKYHNSGGPDWHLILDSVQVLAMGAFPFEEFEEHPHIID